MRDLPRAHGRRPFEIALPSGGLAKATRGEGLTGIWEEEAKADAKYGWTIVHLDSYASLISARAVVPIMAPQRGQSVLNSPSPAKPR